MDIASTTHETISGKDGPTNDYYEGTSPAFKRLVRNAKTRNKGYFMVGYLLCSNAMQLLFNQVDPTVSGYLRHYISEYHHCHDTGSSNDLWGVFKSIFPDYMTLVPARHKESFMLGVEEAIEDGAFASFDLPALGRPVRVHDPTLHRGQEDLRGALRDGLSGDHPDLVEEGRRDHVDRLGGNRAALLTELLAGENQPGQLEQCVDPSRDHHRRVRPPLALGPAGLIGHGCLLLGDPLDQQVEGRQAVSVLGVEVSDQGITFYEVIAHLGNLLLVGHLVDRGLEAHGPGTPATAPEDGILGDVG